MNRLILSKIEELKYKLNDDYTNTTSDTNNNATKTYNTISNVTQEVTTIKNKIGVLSDMFTDLRVLNGTAKNIINLSTVPIVENNGIKISNDKFELDTSIKNRKEISVKDSSISSLEKYTLTTSDNKKTDIDLGNDKKGDIGNLIDVAMIEIEKENTTLKARAISKKERKDNINNAEKLSSPLFSQRYTLNKATGKEYKMRNINPAYSGSSAFTLTDGLFGTRQSYDRWVGTLGEDYVVELDLKEKTQVKNISINFLDEKGSWIFAPMEVSFFISKDKKEWEKIKTINTKDIKPNENSIFTYNSELKKEIGRTKCENVPKYVSVMFDDVRYIRIEAKSIKTCPEGHSGYGYKAHCFADEITVE